MALDASKVRVALTGRVWFVPSSVTPATEPTAPTGIITGAIDLGFTSEDGVTITRGAETEDILGWQSTSPLRRIVTSTPTTVSFTLMQLETPTLTAALGGKVTKPTSGPSMWEPDSAKIVEGALYVDFIDGAVNYRWGFRRAQQTGEVEMQLVRSGAIQLPTEWTAMATKDAKPEIFLLTDDPAFTASA